MIDPDTRSYKLIPRVFDGASKGLTRDDILNNVTLYWLTNAAVSSVRLYGTSIGTFFSPRGVPLPTGVSAFAEEIYQGPESWARRAYPKLIYYRRHPEGTHFAAWEKPQAFTEGRSCHFSNFALFSVHLGAGVPGPPDQEIRNDQRASHPDFSLDDGDR